MRVVLALWLVVLFVSTTSQSSPWQDARALWRQATVTSPQKPRVWVNYGIALRLAGDLDGAERAYRRALDVADDRPDGAMGRTMAAVNLAMLYCGSGRVERAYAVWRMADPAILAAYVDPGNRLSDLNQLDLCATP